MIGLVMLIVSFVDPDPEQTSWLSAGCKTAFLPADGLLPIRYPA
jgi:hypothetical protein